MLWRWESDQWRLISGACGSYTPSYSQTVDMEMPVKLTINVVLTVDKSRNQRPIHKIRLTHPPSQAEWRWLMGLASRPFRLSPIDSSLWNGWIVHGRAHLAWHWFERFVPITTCKLELDGCVLWFVSHRWVTVSYQNKMICFLSKLQ